MIDRPPATGGTTIPMVGMLSKERHRPPSRSISLLTDRVDHAKEVGLVNERLLTQRLSRLPAHPRLLWPTSLTPLIRERIATVPLLDQTWKKVLRAADGMCQAPPIEHHVIGRRMLHVSRQCLKRVLYLGAAWRITDDARYLDKAETELLAAARFADWNPTHFLDTAEMTAAVAIGYDWLYHQLDDAMRTELRTAIIDKGLQPSFQYRWPVSGPNNWNQVGHSSLVLGALVVADFQPDIAVRIITRAVENVPLAMVHYQPDGAYPEGPTYWDYGTSFNILLVDALNQALGEHFGLLDQPAFLDTGNYYLHVTGPTGIMFNYADSGTRRHPSPAQLWLARWRDDPTLAYNELPALRAMDAIDAIDDTHRLLPLAFVWAPPLNDLKRPQCNSYLGCGPNPVGLHRSGWHDQAVYIGLKGGCPGWAHGHMDTGQFVLDADGVRWSCDLGAQSYHALESRGLQIWSGRQESDRWKLFRYTNFAHSTLTVDDQLQRAESSTPIIQHAQANDQTHAHTVIDMSEAYRGQLASVRRGVMLLADGRVLVQDEVEARHDTSDTTTVRWVMVTPGELEATGPGEAILTAQGQHLTLRLLGFEMPPTLTTWSLQPPNPWDADNPGKQRVGFELPLRTSQQATWAVLLIPGSIASRASTTPVLQPLRDWSPPLKQPNT